MAAAVVEAAVAAAARAKPYHHRCPRHRRGRISRGRKKLSSDGEPQMTVMAPRRSEPAGQSYDPASRPACCGGERFFFFMNEKRRSHLSGSRLQGRSSHFCTSQGLGSICTITRQVPPQKKWQRH